MNQPLQTQFQAAISRRIQSDFESKKCKLSANYEEISVNTDFVRLQGSGCGAMGCGNRNPQMLAWAERPSHDGISGA